MKNAKMFKIFKNKRGFNDVSIATGIFSVFLLLGLFLPFINQAFGVTSSTADLDGMETEFGESVENVNVINAFTLLFSVFKMFFWTFGDLVWWLDVMFLIPRFVLAYLIYRGIRGI